MEIRFFDGTDNLSDALWVRDEVFTKEQGFTIPDEDEFDAVSRHMVVYREGRPAATGRVYCDADGETFHIGRIAVCKAFRGEQLGRLLMERLEAAARERGAKKSSWARSSTPSPFMRSAATGPRGNGSSRNSASMRRLSRSFSEHPRHKKRPAERPGVCPQIAYFIA